MISLGNPTVESSEMRTDCPMKDDDDSTTPSLCDEDMESYDDGQEQSGCFAYCTDLEFFSNEPLRFLEQRIVDAHRRLFDTCLHLQDSSDHDWYTVVNPKMHYNAQVPRTGSNVFTTKKGGTVNTAATADTSCAVTNRLPRNEGSTCLKQLGSFDSLTEDDGDDHEEAALAQSYCCWGYFVDAVPESSHCATAKQRQSYRSFMETELAVSSELQVPTLGDRL